MALGAAEAEAEEALGGLFGGDLGVTHPVECIVDRPPLRRGRVASEVRKLADHRVSKACSY